MIVSPKGKSAITDYRVLDSWDGHHLLELHPRTGRTHQIRYIWQKSAAPSSASQNMIRP